MRYFNTRHRPIDMLRYAGLFTWLCAALPLPLMKVIYQNPLPQYQYMIWWGLHFLFGFAYWHLVRFIPGHISMGQRMISLILMTGSALGVSIASASGLGGILLLIVAGLLPWLLPAVPAVSWLIGQNIALAIAASSIPEVSASDAALTAGLFLGISLFAFMSSVVALRHRHAQDELRKVNSELRATQSLLAENTRIAERVRISRELHDLVGHHLTALTLNLEVATHMVESNALKHVQQAHSLAKLLLADVREVVSDMRKDAHVDLTAALKTLIEGVPEPKIHLDLPGQVALTEPQSAQILLRCAQEMITNSVRHARAKNLWIRLSQNADGLALSARDDGQGTTQVNAGNGLSGMAERLRQLGGKLEVESEPGAGFSLHAWIPKEAI